MESRRCESRTADRGEARATLYPVPLRTRMGPQINSRPRITSMFEGQQVGGKGVSAASATAYVHGTPRYRWFVQARIHWIMPIIGTDWHFQFWCIVFPRKCSHIYSFFFRFDDILVNAVGNARHVTGREAHHHNLTMLHGGVNRHPNCCCEVSWLVLWNSTSFLYNQNLKRE